MARTEKSKKALKSVKGMKSVKQIKAKGIRVPSVSALSLDSISPKKLMKKVSGKNVQKSMPWVVAGLAFGAGIYYANRALQKNGGFTAVAKNLSGKIPASWTAWATGADEDSEVGQATNPSKSGKPYPVESTSKKHSKTRMQMRDTQKLDY